MNNLYGTVMMKKLPVGGLKWVTRTMDEWLSTIDRYTADDDIGYMLITNSSFNNK